LLNDRFEIDIQTRPQRMSWLKNYITEFSSYNILR
jgi:hypothetical protein